MRTVKETSQRGSGHQHISGAHSTGRAVLSGFMQSQITATVQECRQDWTPPPDQVKESTRNQQSVTAQTSESRVEGRAPFPGIQSVSQGWDNTVSLQRPREGIRAHPGTTRHRVHHGQNISNPGNLWAEVKDKLLALAQAEELNKNKNTAKDTGDQGEEELMRKGKSYTCLSNHQ